MHLEYTANGNVKKQQWVQRPLNLEDPVQYAYSYESTVENIASSIIIHEWLSHIKLEMGTSNNNHSQAYQNVMTSKLFWNKITDMYKYINKELMKRYIEKENRN